MRRFDRALGRGAHDRRSPAARSAGQVLWVALVLASLSPWLGCGSEPAPIADQKEIARIAGSIPDVPDVPDVPVEAQRKGAADVLDDFKGLCEWEKLACETAARDCFRCLGDEGLSSVCKAPCGKALGACEAAAICVESFERATELIR